MNFKTMGLPRNTLFGLIDEIRASQGEEGGAGGVSKAEPKADTKKAKAAGVGAKPVKAKADAKAKPEAKKVDAPKVEPVAPAASAVVEPPKTVEVVSAPKGGFVLEDNIPLPSGRGGSGGSEPKYPWAVMNVDQSFFIPDGKIRTVYASASKAAKRTGRKFSSRPVEGGVRVWRTA